MTAIQEFLLFLADWDKKMPLDERSGLAEPKMADKIAFAGGGNVRYTAYMLREAAIQAINKSSSRILNSHLSKGYDSISRFFPGKENPFK